MLSLEVEDRDFISISDMYDADGKEYPVSKKISVGELVEYIRQKLDDG